QLLAENRRTQFALLSFLRIALVSAMSLLRPFGANAQNSHDNGATPRQHSVRHVLLLSVDGMHNLDLANLVKNRPGSALSILSSHAVTYSTLLLRSRPTRGPDCFPS